MTTKDSNPKDALGIRKVPVTTVPFPVIAEMGLGMLEGALKYGRHNYRAIGVRSSVYIDAAIRHLMAYWEGEDIDPDSGLPHIIKAACCCAVLRDAEIQNKVNDDRPPRTPKNWISNLNTRVSELMDKYPEPVKPYTQAMYNDIQPEKFDSATAEDGISKIIDEVKKRRNAIPLKEYCTFQTSTENYK